MEEGGRPFLQKGPSSLLQVSLPFSPSKKSDMDNKKVIVLTTGGTIAMKLDPAHGIVPAVSGEDLVASVPGLRQKALEYAKKKHEGQFRIGGAPFIVHPIAVAEILRQDGKQVEYRVAAVFHDLLEDTDASEQEIVEIGGEDVLKAVKLVTKEKEYCMETYIAGIKTNSMAYAVKGADRLHNLQSAFCANEKFRKKYIRETLDWYMKFRPEIPEVVAELIESLSDDEEKEKFRAEIEHFVEK